MILLDLYLGPPARLRAMYLVLLVLFLALFPVQLGPLLVMFPELQVPLRAHCLEHQELLQIH